MQSTLLWGETYSIGGCVSSEHEMATIYNLNKRSCRKKRGEGVATGMRNTKETRKGMAAKLMHGDWVMFESPEPNVQPFWIGRAVSKAEWNNSCTYQNET